MKKILFTLLITIVSFCGYAQDSKALDTIYLKNGDHITAEINYFQIQGKKLWYSKYTINHMLKPRKHGVTKKIVTKSMMKIPANSVERIVLINSNNAEYYEFAYSLFETAKIKFGKKLTFKHLKFKNKEWFLPILTEGACDLFLDVVATGETQILNRNIYSNKYYLKRKNEKKPKSFTAKRGMFGKGTGKILKDYFSECQKVIDYINSY